MYHNTLQKPIKLYILLFRVENCFFNNLNKVIYVQSFVKKEFS